MAPRGIAIQIITIPETLILIQTSRDGTTTTMLLYPDTTKVKPTTQMSLEDITIKEIRVRVSHQAGFGKYPHTTIPRMCRVNKADPSVQRPQEPEPRTSTNLIIPTRVEFRESQATVPIPLNCIRDDQEGTSPLPTGLCSTDIHIQISHIRVNGQTKGKIGQTRVGKIGEEIIY
jgi:hypothetical protein